MALFGAGTGGVVRLRGADVVGPPAGVCRCSRRSVGAGVVPRPTKRPPGVREVCASAGGPTRYSIMREKRVTRAWWHTSRSVVTRSTPWTVPAARRPPRPDVRFASVAPCRHRRRAGRSTSRRQRCPSPLPRRSASPPTRTRHRPRRPPRRRPPDPTVVYPAALQPAPVQPVQPVQPVPVAPARPADPSVDAGRFWAGVVATALVAALVGLVGVVIVDQILDIELAVQDIFGDGLDRGRVRRRRRGRRGARRRAAAPARAHHPEAARRSSAGSCSWAP